MATNEMKIQRPVAVHVQIENHLREQIRSGVLRAGDKLPAVPDLAAQLGVHVVTVQKALRRLKVAGILHRTPRVGTFVRSSPQNAQIGVFFGPNLSDECTHFYRAVSKALQGLVQRRKQKYRIYDDINAANTEAALVKLPSYQHYLMDRSNHVFGGIIAIGTDVKWIEFFRKTPHLPFASGGSGDIPGTDVYFDRYESTRECVSYFASRGKKRLLYLRTVKGCQADLEGFRSAVKEHDFDDARIEELTMHTENHYQEAVACERLSSLAQRWNKTNKMPDAILVSDDIAMRGAALALVRHQIKVPEDMEILTWANEGIVHHYGIPVTRYEVSPKLFAQKLFDVLCSIMDETKPENLPCKIRGRIVEDSTLPAPGRRTSRRTAATA